MTIAAPIHLFSLFFPSLSPLWWRQQHPPLVAGRHNLFISISAFFSLAHYFNPQFLHIWITVDLTYGLSREKEEKTKTKEKREREREREREAAPLRARERERRERRERREKTDDDEMTSEDVNAGGDDDLMLELDLDLESPFEAPK